MGSEMCIRDRINSSAEQTRSAHEARRALIEQVESFGADGDKYNALIASMTEAGPEDKRLVVERGTQAGLVWSREDRRFITENAAPAAPPSEEEAPF